VGITRDSLRSRICNSFADSVQHAEFFALRRRVRLTNEKPRHFPEAANQHDSISIFLYLNFLCIDLCTVFVEK
jgi:hypothetical protein